MKIFKLIALFVATNFLFTACNDDDNGGGITGEGTVTLKFDNAVNSDNDLVLNTTNYSNTSNNTYNIKKAKYIVSNIRLVKADGTEFTYPQDKSSFIIDEANANNAGEILVNLTDVPASDYKSIKFGIGVSQEQYLRGADGQGEFLAQAQDANMVWNWAAGYKFYVLEGNFTAPTIATSTAYKIHMGSHGSTLDNYKEVTLDLPSTAKVRTDKTPQIHIMHMIAKVFDGSNTIDLSEQSDIMIDPVRAPKISTNVNGSFMVHHVHND